MRLLAGGCGARAFRGCPGADLSDQDGALHLRRHAGQRVRHHGAHPGGEALRVARPAGDRREPPRRRRPGRREVGRARQEPDGHNIMMYASAFTVSTLLNPGARPEGARAGGDGGDDPDHPDHAAGEVQDGEGLRRGGEGAARQARCATAGIGSATHMAFERFRFAAGFEVLNVHTKGAGEALTEVISGRADCYFALVFQAQKMKDAGKVDALARQRPEAHFADARRCRPRWRRAIPDSDYNFWVGTLVAAEDAAPDRRAPAQGDQRAGAVARDQRSDHQARRRSAAACR